MSCAPTTYYRRQRTAHEITQKRRCSRTNSHVLMKPLSFTGCFSVFIFCFWCVRKENSSGRELCDHVLFVVRCDALSSDSTSKNRVYSSGAFWDQDGGYASAVGSITCVRYPPRGLPECSRGVVARVTLWRCRDALSSL